MIINKITANISGRLSFLSLSIVILLTSNCAFVENEIISETKDNKIKENKAKEKEVIKKVENDKPVQDIKSIEISDNKDINKFNRLLRHKGKYGSDVDENLYDKGSKARSILQDPKEAFDPLPKAKMGNGIDWVKALESGKIKPYNDLYDKSSVPLIMDLNIVREVKGTMPNVIFPHKQHTELLDCTNCHPSIFIPQKGANKISMAENLMGKKCGVCHGKVAFPLSRCTSCHSGKKQMEKSVKNSKWKWP